MRALRIVLLVAGLVAAGLGVEGLVQAARNRQQMFTTCDDVARQRPGALWLRVTGCDVDYMTPSVRDPNGRIVEMFFPVRATGLPPGARPSLVVATRDPEALAIAQQTIGDHRQPDQEALTVMGLRIVTVLRASREVEGFVRSGMLVRLRSLITRRGATADPSAIVLDLHARPSVVIPAVEAGVGLAALVAFAVLTRRARKSVPVPAAEAEATAPPVAEAEVATKAPEPLPDPLTPFEPKPALEPALPAMLLLKLDQQAGPEAIEHAPPLGAWDDVARVIAGAYPGIAFDEQGRAVVERQDFALILEVGARGSSPVWTVTVRARGPAAMEAVQTLVARAGWRGFVPKTGAFVPVPDREVVTTASDAHGG